MIKTAHSKGWNARRTAAHINDSVLASRLAVNYGVREIAAKLANITMGR